MFDMTAIDSWYEATKEDGGPISFGLLDKRVLVPLPQLLEMVKGETGEDITIEALDAKAKAGWFPWQEGPGQESGVKGAPLYAPSRVGFFLQLEREGYSPEELRIIAEMEEWYIDNLWAADEMAYLDDDLETMILFHSERAVAFNHSDPPETEQVDKIRKQVQRLRNFQVEGIPEKLRPVIKKDAFRARAWNEMMRVTFLNQERDKIRAGYSPFVSMRSWSYGMGIEAGFTGGEVNWKETVKAALTYTKDEDLPSIRIPGVLFRGDLVTPTRTLRPSEYEALWKERDVEGYLQAWSEVRGERLCMNCFAPLSGNERKKFCGEKCRNAMKQRRYKERNPEAVLKAQEKYWSS